MDGAKVLYAVIKKFYIFLPFRLNVHNHSAPLIGTQQAAVKYLANHDRQNYPGASLI